MLIIVIVMFVISLVIHGYYRYQIRELAKQMEDMRQGNHNQLLTQEIYTKELNELVDEINNTIAVERELRTQDLRKSQQEHQLLTNLSHDVRTPLTSLIGYLQLLELSDNPLDKERYLEIINERASTLKRLLDELFLLSRLEDTNYQPVVTQVNLTKLLRRSILGFHDELAQRDFEVDVDIPEELLIVWGPEELLERVVNNLLLNVIQHGREKLVVTLEEEPSSSQIKLSLINLISADVEVDSHNLTQRYVTSRAMNISNNTGLGLNIVKAAISKLKGDMKISVDENNFVVEIYFKTSQADG